MASNGLLADGMPSSNSLQVDPQVPIHSFDPHATPAEKGAAAARSSDLDKLKSIIPDNKSDARGNRVSSIYINAADARSVDAGGANIIPTITVEDADHKHAANDAEPPHEEPSEHPPGAFPTRAADAIPHWYRVGWREISGMDRMQLEGEAKDHAVLDLFISEQFYGDWYHNAGVIVFVCAYHRRVTLNLTTFVVLRLSWRRIF
jgi:hypothetical protein